MSDLEPREKEVVMIDQLTACLPNEPGRLAAMCRVLGEQGVQIFAIMVAETTDFGIVRVVCDRPLAMACLLSSMGMSVTTSKIVAVELDNVPGALAGVLDRLASCDLNVEYAYSCPIEGRTVSLIKVSGEPLEVKLGGAGLTLLAPKDLYVPDED